MKYRTSMNTFDAYKVEREERLVDALEKIAALLNSILIVMEETADS